MKCLDKYKEMFEYRLSKKHILSSSLLNLYFQKYQNILVIKLADY